MRTLRDLAFAASSPPAASGGAEPALQAVPGGPGKGRDHHLSPRQFVRAGLAHRPHEGLNFRASGSSSVGNSLIIERDPDKLTPIARQMIETVNEKTIDDADRQFVLLQRSGGAQGSLMRAAREQLDAHTMITETVHAQGQRQSLRVRQQRILLNELLHEIEMLDDPMTDVLAPPREAQEPQSWVAIYDQTPGTPRRVARRAADQVRELERATPTFVGAKDVRRATALPFAAVVIAGEPEQIDPDALRVLEDADLPLLWVNSVDEAGQIGEAVREHIAEGLVGSGRG